MRMNRFLSLLILLGALLSVAAPASAQLYGWPYSSQPPSMNLRSRVTIANINAGYTLLPAIPGWKYRLVDATAIAYGGACAAVTSVDIKSTQATAAVALVTLAQANLTQSTVLSAGATGAAVLADGASFAPNDAGAAITIIKNGSDVTTCTGIDVILTYALER